MSLRWEIGNKVQALNAWVRQRFGRTGDDQRHQVRNVPKPPDGRGKDAPQPPR